MRPPKHMRDLLALGVDQEHLARAQEWFGKRGIACGYSTIRRSWSFACVGRLDGPAYVICWVGVEAFVDMLDAPAQTVKAMYERGADVRIRPWRLPCIVRSKEEQRIRLTCAFRDAFSELVGGAPLNGTGEEIYVRVAFGGDLQRQLLLELFGLDVGHGHIAPDRQRERAVHWGSENSIGGQTGKQALLSLFAD